MEDQVRETEGVFSFSASKTFKVTVGRSDNGEFPVLFDPPFLEAEEELGVNQSVIIEWAKQEAVRKISEHTKIDEEKLHPCSHFGIGKVFVRIKN